MAKKMYSRTEFKEHLEQSAEKMAQNIELQQEAINLLVKADRFNWIHQTTWFGEPILNVPQDMFALQEIIFKTKPEYIIEVGVAWGGSLLFYSTLMEVLGGKKVIGIDIYIPDDLKKRIGSHGNVSERIQWINGSSIEENTINQVKEIIGNSKKVMVILDSNHTHDHVIKELKLYSQFVGKDQYLICGDTIIEYMPEQELRIRPWGKGNNPKTAVDAFLLQSNRFQIDRTLENKLLISCNPGGYLYAIKE